MASLPSKTGHDCRIFVVTVMFMLGLSGHVTSNCAHPGAGLWFVPADGKVFNFTDNTVAGHTLVHSAGIVMNVFSPCVPNDDDNVYIATIGIQAKTDRLYFCWKLVDVSANVMLLYELTAEDTTGNVPNGRVKYQEDGDPIPEFSDICVLDAAVLQPKLLYKVDSNSATDISVASLDASKTECPASMQNIYSYVMGTDCQGTDSTLDVCQDTKAVRVNYSVCPDKPILFSNDGLLSCLANYTVSGTTYVLMGNHDATVSSPTTSRFACIKITSETTFDAYDSDCSDMASATHKQLTVTVKGSCESSGGAEGEGTGAGGEDSLSDEIIIGVVVGVVVIVAVIGVIVIVVLKMKGLLCFHSAATVSP